MAATTSIEEDTAALRTFAITELLEQILSALDMQTLLLAQRVSTHFKAVIDGSTVLQQALFFQLQTARGENYLGHDGINSFVDPDSPFSRPLTYYGWDFVCTFSLEQFRPDESRLVFRTRTRDWWGPDGGECTGLDGKHEPSWQRM